MAMGMNFGPPPPGAPPAVVQNNLTVTGGTGAFLGVRGQAGNALEGFRMASISEHPANRRINGEPAEVLYAIGHSGTAGVYQVSFAVPPGIGAGLASLRVAAAWIVGPEVQIAIR
jgi:uncharacterized protein (TIGR03437 family)